MYIFMAKCQGGQLSNNTFQNMPLEGSLPNMLSVLSLASY